MSVVAVLSSSSSSFFPNHFKPYNAFKSQLPSATGNPYEIITTTSKRQERLKCSSRRNLKPSLLSTCCSSLGIALCLLEASSSTSSAGAAISFSPHDEVTETTTLRRLIHHLSLGDLDPGTAKVAIGIIGPILSLFSFLFILRVIMSWYPKLPVGKFPYVIAYAPTEPFLVPTRKLIPPLAGVDITPVVWVGLTNFLSEILLGPQGLLVLLSQQQTPN